MIEKSISSAELLSGRDLGNGWKVTSKIEKEKGSTGGHFSVAYLVVSRKGGSAFLKALDYSKALEAPDPASALKQMTEAFIYERDILQKCQRNRMDKVVTAITDGTIRIDNPNDTGVVQYLIFELADGDVRSQSDASKQFDLALSLRYLHHIATGLSQLHSREIAHQDLKPSNVLIFNDDTSKIADLGRASDIGLSSPFDDYEIAGDLGYAPPELLYGSINSDWRIRRFGCDMYHLGSMAIFFFLGSGATAIIHSYLHESHRYSKWSGTFQDVLPYIHQAFEQLLSDLMVAISPDLQEGMVRAVRELCEPDPSLRGHPKNRFSERTQFSMERYITLFNLLASRAEAGLIGKI